METAESRELVPKPRPKWARRWSACGRTSDGLVTRLRAFALPCDAARRLAKNVTYGRGNRVVDYYGLPDFQCHTVRTNTELVHKTCRVQHYLVKWDGMVNPF